MDAAATYEFFNQNMWPGRYAECPAAAETLELIQNYKRSDNPVRIAGCGTQKIETERLLLRPFQLDDVLPVLKNRAWDEEVQKIYDEPVYNTQQKVKERLEKYIASYSEGA